MGIMEMGKQMRTTNEVARFALIRAKIELECIDDPEMDFPVGLSRKFVRESTLETIKDALELLDGEIEIKENSNG